ncbi:MAG: PH domain-containing protein [Woeseiaceae bacterium]|nr:PH domain-containing protein [Woeseiaceae bacterium]
MFQNPEISLEHLPSLDHVDWQPLHDRYVAEQVVARTGTLAFLVVLMCVVEFAPPVEIPLTLLRWGVLGLFGAALLTWPLVAVPRQGYIVRDKDIVFRAGVLWRSVTAIPYNRIQHVETSSTPLNRHFGTATLKLFTAGGAGGDMKIDGLPADTAEQLRVMILEKAGASIEQS